MAKLIAQCGSVTVILRDDRAELSGSALKEWKAAATDLVAGAAALLIVEESSDD